MTYNIDRSNTDQFYRYKMPRLIAKVEGSGNGIKTVIANITDIARSLERPPTYPLKYFGYELGAQTMIDAKNERYIVNGSHEAVRLQEMLDGFIKKFVLCPNCNNPETRLIVQPKKNIIRQKCAACGHECMADMKHKLSSYVLKNPPPETGEYGETVKSSKKSGKKGKGKEEAAPSKNGTNGTAAADAKAPISPTNESGDPFSVSADPPPPTNGDGEDSWDDDDWQTDELTEEARKHRQLELTSGIKNLTLDDDLEKTEDDRLDLFYEFVKKQREANQVDDKKIMAEAERLEVKEKAPLILARVLFDDDMCKQIGRYKKVFARFTVGDRKAQKYLLGGFEHLVGEAFTGVLMPKAMKLLKEFYDQDILEEEAILDWYDKPRKTFVKLSVAENIRKKVEPLVVWLREAEEESSENEEESDGEVEVQKVTSEGAGDVGKTAKMVNGGGNHSAANKVTGKTQTNGGTNGKAGATTPPTEDDDEEDVDIDAI